jgi:hypothetical protein
MPCSSTAASSRARGRSRSRHRSPACGDIAAAIANAFAPETPVAQHDVGVADGGLGDAEAAARDPFVVAQATLVQIGECGVREHELVRRETGSDGARRRRSRRERT